MRSVCAVPSGGRATAAAPVRDGVRGLSAAVSQRKPWLITVSRWGLASPFLLCYSVGVRCGSLARMAREPRECFGGACVDANSFVIRASVCPRQGPRPTEVLRGFCVLGLTGCTAQASKHDPGCIEMRKDVAQTASAPKPIARVDPGTGGCMGQPHGVPVMRTSSVSHSVSSRRPSPSLLAGLGLSRPEPF